MNSKNKPNGHAARLAKERGADGTMLLSRQAGAASDDASEISVAIATASSAVTGAEREAYADVAPSEDDGKQLSTATPASQSQSQKGGKRKGKEASTTNAKRKIPPGTEALPIDGEAFVDAVHSRVDLVLLEEKLLNSKDDKVAQRELAYLRELRYGKRAAPIDDDVPRVILDIQRPERDMP
jgi:hypothetical protein